MLILLLLPIAAPSASAKHLEPWLQQTLLPYLAKRLSRYPRFKNQSFEIVAFKNSAIETRMNGLTAYIRRQMIERLQSVPGADLVMPAPISSRPGQRKLDELNCPARQRANILVTVEVNRFKPGSDLRVTVGAIDRVENSWVRGFKQVWSGTPTDTERKLLARQVVDSRQLGARGLPFTAREPDRLASYLISSVGCLLKRGSQHPQTVYVRSPRDSSQPPIKNVLALFKRYLSGFPTIKVVSDRSMADSVLALKTLRVAARLYQVWVELQDNTEQNATSSSFDHAIYVRFNAPKDTPASTAQHSKESPAKPAPRAAVFPGRAAEPLIGSFRLVTPPRVTLCDTAATWEQGAVTVRSDMHLPSGGCYAIRYRAQRTATVYLFSQTDDGQLTRLLPNRCNALGLGARGAKPARGKTVHVPLFDDKTPAYLRLDGHAGIERIYVVAVKGTPLPAKLSPFIRDATSLCSARMLKDNARSARDFEAVLRELARENSARFAWRVRQFHQDAPRHSF